MRLPTPSPPLVLAARRIVHTLLNSYTINLIRKHMLNLKLMEKDSLL
jgi:hypothetical protein